MKKSSFFIIMCITLFLLFSLSGIFSKEQSKDPNKILKKQNTTEEELKDMPKEPNEIWGQQSASEQEQPLLIITDKTIEKLKDIVWYEIDDDIIAKAKSLLNDDKLKSIKTLKDTILTKEDISDSLKAMNFKDDEISSIMKYSENKLPSSRTKILAKLFKKSFTEKELTSSLDELGFNKKEIGIILSYAEQTTSEKELYNWMTYKAENGLIYNGVLTFEFDPQGYAWIGTGNDTDPKVGGVSILTPRGQFVSYTVKDGLPDNRVNDILFLPLTEEDVINSGKGGTWIATGYGLIKLDRKGKKTTYDKANSALPDNRVSSLLLDKYGDLWISTFGGGVAMFPPKGKWSIYNRNNGLAGNKVVPSFKDKDGNLWFGIWDGGLSTLEPGLTIDNETLKNLKPLFKDSKDKDIKDKEDKNKGNKDNSEKDKGGKDNSGKDKGDKDKKTRIELLETLKNKKYSETELISNLEELNFTEKDIETVLNEVKGSGLKWTNYSMGNSGLVSNSVTCITQNPVDGKMWFGTTEGLSAFDGKNWTTYKAEQDKFVISNFVASMAFEKNGDLWIGYWGGGVTLLRHDGTYKNFKAENSGLVSDYVGAIAIDKQDNKWFGTYSGFSILHEEKRDTVTGDPLFADLYSRLPFNAKFNLIGKPEFSDFFSFTGKAGIHKPEPENFNTASYHWQMSGGKNERISLRFAMPIDHYGNVIWSYGAFWGDGINLGQGGAMSYSMTEDMMGNNWAEFSGEIKSADFLSYGYTSDYISPVVDPKKSYPFPQAMPVEVKKYLLPGHYLSSDNPDVYKMARSIVKESSASDMYLTVKDIVYSDLFRDMPYSYFLNVSEDTKNEKFMTGTSKEGLVEDPATTLKKNTGVCWSKARLFCSLCKAAGVPARLVVANGPYVWSEVWINGIGWVPAESSLPIYDYGAANRISFPKIFLDSKIPVSSISGNDDDTKSIDWYPSVKATFDRVNPKELLDLSKLTQTKILIVHPAEKKRLEKIPVETMIPLSEGFYFMVEKEGREEKIKEDELEKQKKNHDDTTKDLYDLPSLKTDIKKENKVTPPEKTTPVPEVEDTDKEIYDIENNEEIKAVSTNNEVCYNIVIYNEQSEKVDEIPIEEPGKSVTIEKKDIVTLTFIPVNISNYLILDIISWDIKQGKGSKEKTPVPSPTPQNGNDKTPAVTVTPAVTPTPSPSH